MSLQVCVSSVPVGMRVRAHHDNNDGSHIVSYHVLLGRLSDQIRSSLAAPLTLAEVSSLGHQSQDAQIESSALLGAGPGAWNSGPTVLDSLNDRVGLACGSWRETQRLDTTRHVEINFSRSLETSGRIVSS